MIHSLKQLMDQYTGLFRINPEAATSMPRKTKTFQEIKPYIHVFDIIMHWFQYGEYDLSRENLIIRVKTLEKLFEYYCLIKLLDMFQKNGYIDSSNAIKFKYVCNDARYEAEDEIPNTYYLRKGDSFLTIYYQPVIRSDLFQNELSLYRVLYYEKENHWEPDFVIKCSKDDQNEYLIFDSKFASRNTIRSARLHDIIQKYAIETAIARGSTETQGDVPKMVWALQGRVDGADLIWSLQKSRTYDSTLANKYRTVSCGIASINALNDARPLLWREMKKCIPWI